MSLIAEFHLRDSRLPLSDTIAAAPEATIAVDRMMIMDRDHLAIICWVEAASFGMFETALEKDETVVTHSILEDFTEQRHYHIQLEKPMLLQLKVAFDEFGAVPGGTTILDGQWNSRAYFPNRDALRQFRDACHEYGVAFQLKSLYEPKSKNDDLSGLTPKQRETLEIAYKHGYFDIPRQMTLDDLSEQLGISKPSVSKRLRRAQQYVIGNAVNGDSI